MSMMSRLRDRMQALWVLMPGRRVTEREPDASRIIWRTMSAAGVNVDADTAMKTAVVWACVTYLSRTVAQLPWRVMSEDSEGRAIRASGSAMDYLLNVRPNPEMGSFSFRETMIGWACRRGNAVAEIQRDMRGVPYALWPIHPSRGEFRRDAETGELVYKLMDGSDAILRPYDYFHLRGFGEGPIGLDVVAYAAESIGWAQATEIFGSTFFGSGINPSIAVTVPGKLTKEGKDVLREELDDLFKGPTKANRAAILDADMKIEALTIDPNKAQFLETREHQVEEICFVPGTGVYTPNGVKSIEQIEPGEFVLTHRGRWRKVNRIMRRPYVGEVVTVRGKGLNEVTATPNHPFYVQRVKRSRENRLTADGAPVWTDAGSLTPVTHRPSGERSTNPFDALTIPEVQHDFSITRLDMAEWCGAGAVVGEDSVRISNNARATEVRRFPSADGNLGWICGLYAADGSCSGHQVVFYLGAHEREETALLVSRLGSVFGVNATVTETGGNVARIVVSNTVLAQFFSEFGNSAASKHLPGWAMAASPEFMRGAIDGLVAGDGCEYEGRRQLRSISDHLVAQTRLMLWTLGTNSTVYRYDAQTWQINGRSGISAPISTVEWSANKVRRGTMGIAEGVRYFNLIEVRKSVYHGDVFNLEVEEDESYTTEGGCVHNCRWFGVPPHKVMHLVRSTFSNIEHQAIEVVTDSIVPWCRRLEEEADYKLFSPRSPMFTRLDLKGLLRGDFKTRSEGLQIMRRNGVISANDWLRLEDMNEIGDMGDIYVVESNMTRLELVGQKPAAPASKNAPAVPANEPPDPEDPNAEDPEDPADPADAAGATPMDRATTVRRGLRAGLAGASPIPAGVDTVPAVAEQTTAGPRKRRSTRAAVRSDQS